MTDNVENLPLEHMKRFQTLPSPIESKLDDLTVRVANLESGQAMIMQHLAHFSAADAAQQLAIDTIGRRLDRIERRLELTN